ncbi:subtilisin-like protease 2, putative [Plasmodium malariae]|uniref:subtilisin n=1 Tax=Plasmodium malariae TaxID=5858 RepID=A0A1A8X5Z8_PLAMA|nr:subtilisin-like protease 2, putative [Plasmodium malariae]
MLNSFYVLTLILANFIFYKNCHNQKYLKVLGVYNIKLIKRRSRILINGTIDKTEYLDEIKESYKPLFDVYEISANFEKLKISKEKEKKKKKKKKKREDIKEEKKEQNKESNEQIHFLEFSLKNPHEQRDILKGRNQNDPHKLGKRNKHSATSSAINIGMRNNDNHMDVISKSNEFDSLIKDRNIGYVDNLDKKDMHVEDIGSNEEEISKPSRTVRAEGQNEVDVNEMKGKSAEGQAGEVIKQEEQGKEHNLHAREKEANERQNEKEKKQNKVDIHNDRGDNQNGEHSNLHDEDQEEEENESSDDVDQKDKNYELNEDGKDMNDEIISREFNNYTIVTNSNDLLSDISVDASEISKLSIGNLSIPYNEKNRTTYTHQRHIVLTNKGNKKYKVVLITKNPKFVEAEEDENEDDAEREENPKPVAIKTEEVAGKGEVARKVEAPEKGEGAENRGATGKGGTNEKVEGAENREEAEKRGAVGIPSAIQETNFIQKKKGGKDEQDESIKHRNLYDGMGTLDFSKAYKNKIRSEKRKEVRGDSSGGSDNSSTSSSSYSASTNSSSSGRGGAGMLKRLLNFLSFSSDEHKVKSDSDQTKDKESAKKNDNSKEMNPDDVNSILSVDKVVDQYLLNLKNGDSSNQELIFVLRGDLDLHSPFMKNVIKNANNKFETYIKKNFEEVDKISYDVSSPINFLCFFVPNVFDMNNYHILKEALTILYKELEEYTENWSFSNMYVTFDTNNDHLYNKDDGMNYTNAGPIKDGEHADTNRKGQAGFGQEEKEKKKEEGKKKYIKKKKNLYNIKYSFLRKFWSMDPFISFARKMNKRNFRVQKEILNFLPKELREYSTWNLSIIRVFNAWFLAGYGNKNVKVCVIDSGVDKNHIDLMKNIYIPEYIDKYEMTEGFYDFMVKNPTDSSGHGTHVTGIIGGEVNDLGMVGVAPNITLISLRFIDGAKYGSSFHAIKAINVCILNKAPIINASWGSSKYDPNIYLAVQRLKYTFNGKGTVLVSAAGNENKNNDEHPLYPANFKLPHVYSVASISKNFEISPFSNYGVKSVHILAPGHHIYSTTPNNSYKINTGTSMAAPHVCGVNALIYSVCYNQGFIPSAEEVLDIITRTSIKVVSRRRKTINDSLVNAEAAVLTTLLGGLWMQMDCHFVKFNLDKGQKKHIPIVFSAYKNGVYETDIVIAVMPTEENSNVYGEILIPIKIVTNTKLANFKESPRYGKKMDIDSNEASNDEVLSYICENALYNLYETDNYFLITSLALFFVAFLLIVAGTIYMTKKIYHDEYCNDDNEHNFENYNVAEKRHILHGPKCEDLEKEKKEHIEKLNNRVRFSIIKGKDRNSILMNDVPKKLKFENCDLVNRSALRRGDTKISGDKNVNETLNKLDDMFME